MKKILCFLCLILLAPIVFFVGCQSSENLQKNSYIINLAYDHSNNTAKANMTVDYVNTSETAFENIVFHLYPNAFTEEAEGSVCSPVNEAKVYPNGKSYGGIEIKTVKVNSEITAYSLQGEFDSHLVVDLNQKLFPDERTQIYIEFDLVLPNANHRYGYGDNAINFANFYPIACVFKENEGFATDFYSPNGDPFFSDCADYQVEITYDNSLKLACSGDKVETNESGQNKITKITASNVRDFAFVLSDKFSVITEKVQDTEVSYYYYDDENPQASLDTAKQALTTFGEFYGEYPYSSFAVVQTNFVYGGMEYPQLVMISDMLEGDDNDYVIVHETAHQWWYGVVGNDEYNESWLDESLTEYSTALFFEKNQDYGISYSQMVSGARSNYNLFIKTYKSIKGEVDTSMNRALDEFETEPEYVNNIYVRGIIMFDTLRSQIGEKKFLNALLGYYSKFKFKNATTADFIATFEEKCGRQMEGFFNSWLLGEVVFIEMN